MFFRYIQVILSSNTKGNNQNHSYYSITLEKLYHFGGSLLQVYYKIAKSNKPRTCENHSYQRRVSPSHGSQGRVAGAAVLTKQPVPVKR